ncbi:VOC family protein [Thalassospira sp. MCCC 1A01428]|uniref:VOC family protein n=1 Tax=unclassified Thalassospira TaxID=2648997 RepID=UPI000A1D80B3|nr:VOC family protein [Thalassospira sp. MCCC 1A01428]OSQ42701.1 extradiol dioxygenase [Thalassospira sp. MCCC 1A01428]
MPIIGQISIVVADYDDAIAFYCEKAGFELIEDSDMGNGKRWVLIAPPRAPVNATRILLARAVNDSQKRAIGQQTGGRVGFFLMTDDFQTDHTRMVENGVRFLENPRHEPYGIVAVFEDLYGNKWDLLQPA